MNHLPVTSRSALRMRSALAGAALAAILSGCGATGEINPALDRTRTSYRALQGDPQVTQLAPVELMQAGEAVRTADTAWTRRESLRTVDHLTYLAQQRIAIARETANTRMWERAAATAKADADNEKARADRDRAARDLSIARRNTQEKAIELAVAKAVAQQDSSNATDLEMQLTDPNAKQTDRGDVITLGEVLFDSNRAELRSGSRRDLAKLVDDFKRNPKRTALIVGFTDNQGSESDNLDLSQRRAGAVRDALVAQGVFADRLSTRGDGDTHPAANNMTQAGRQANRRVEILLSGEDGAVTGR